MQLKNFYLKQIFVGLLFTVCAGTYVSKRIYAQGTIEVQNPGEPCRTTIGATPRPSIFSEITRSQTILHGPSVIHLRVDKNLFSQDSYPQADYFFKDPQTDSIFIGFKISIAVRSGNHPKGEQLEVKIRQGLAEKTSDRTFYLLGHDKKLQSQSELSPAPGQFETFKRIPSNTTVCGFKYGESSFEKSKIRCGHGHTVNELDLVHFIKVSPNQIDQTLTSQLELAVTSNSCPNT